MQVGETLGPCTKCSGNQEKRNVQVLNKKTFENNKVFHSGMENKYIVFFSVIFFVELKFLNMFTEKFIAKDD